MTFNIKGKTFRIRRNKNNKFWNPIGMFSNIAEIKIDNQWYKCSIKFEKKENTTFIQFVHPMIVDEKTPQILEDYIQGIYFESPTTKFKKQLIQYLLGIHKVNYSLDKFKKIFPKGKIQSLFFLLPLFYQRYFST